MSREEFLQRLVELFQFGSLASFGGLVKFLKDHQDHGKPFSLLKFFIQITIAFFVGCVLGDAIASTGSPYKDGYLLAVGFCANEVLSQLESFIKARLENLRGKTDES
jgi:hypothetical protein